MIGPEKAITYKDGRKPFKRGGNNAYPYNFHKLCDLVGAELVSWDGEGEE